MLAPWKLYTQQRSLMDVFFVDAVILMKLDAIKPTSVFYVFDFFLSCSDLGRWSYMKS